MSKLKDKTVIVTGGAGILGQGFCLSLAKVGARVVIVDKFEEAVQETAKNIWSLESSAELLPLACDITDKDQVASLVQTVKHEYKEISVLFNNAASKSKDLSQFFAAFEDYSMDTWREVMSVNLEAMVLMSQAVGKELIKQNKGGSIIQTASIYGVVAPDQRIYEGSEYLGLKINTPAVYAASKAAVIGLTKYLASYWAKHNIRVNSLTPGGIESGQNAAFVTNYSSKVPLGRMGKKEELYGALIFLASDDSSYITGQNLIVDGGFTCW